MKLIRNLGTKKINGYIVSYGEFLCEFDNKIVEKDLSSGKKAKSCGCASNSLRSINLKGRIFSEEHRNKISDALKDKDKSEEHKNKISIAKKGKKAWNKGLTSNIDSRILSGEKNPMYGNGDKRKGELNPNWNGGTSFEPYSPEFNKDLKGQILNRDNYTCQNPNCEHRSTKLDIHHIDYDKKNNMLNNLITLCDSCHTKTNGKNNRQYWIEYYKNVMEFFIIQGGG